MLWACQPLKVLLHVCTCMRGALDFRAAASRPDMKESRVAVVGYWYKHDLPLKNGSPQSIAWC